MPKKQHLYENKYSQETTHTRTNKKMCQERHGMEKKMANRRPTHRGENGSQELEHHKQKKDSKENTLARRQTFSRNDPKTDKKMTQKRYYGKEKKMSNKRPTHRVENDDPAMTHTGKNMPTRNNTGTEK